MSIATNNFYLNYSYPFGMIMPGRKYTKSGGDYRFGFNGMEKDDEVSGAGNRYTTFFRQYDPRLGRWASLDPEMTQLPWQSPYVGMDNNPIALNDPNGDCTTCPKGAEEEDQGRNVEVVNVYGPYTLEDFIKNYGDIEGSTYSAYSETTSSGSGTGLDFAQARSFKVYNTVQVTTAEVYDVKRVSENHGSAKLKVVTTTEVREVSLDNSYKVVGVQTTTSSSETEYAINTGPDYKFPFIFSGTSSEVNERVAPNKVENSSSAEISLANFQTFLSSYPDLQKRLIRVVDNNKSVDFVELLKDASDLTETLNSNP